jgi:hypothetical protein
VTDQLTAEHEAGSVPPPPRGTAVQRWWRPVAVVALLVVAAVLGVTALRHDGGQPARSVAPPADDVDPDHGTTSQTADDVPDEVKVAPRGQELPPAGFPGPDSTGVPAGTTLKVHEGDLTITKDKQVVSGVQVNGCIDVLANDVTITKTLVKCAADHGAIRQYDDFTGLTVSDSSIDGMGIARASYGKTGVTLLRNDIYNVYDGPRVGSHTRIEGNWIHDLVRVGDSHDDTLQTTGATDVVIRGNSLQAYTFAVQDPHNSVLMMTTDAGPALARWVVEGNYMDGGSVALNLRPDARVAGSLRFSGNVFGPNIRHDQTRTGFNRPGITWATDNTWLADGSVAVK